MNIQATKNVSGPRGAVIKNLPGSAIVVILLATLFLTLESAPAVRLIPLATAFMLTLQVTISLLVVPFIKVHLTRISFLMLLLWLTLFAWSLFSVFWSGYATLSFIRCLMICFPPFVLILLIYADSQPVETFWRFARGFVFFGTGLSLIALTLMVTGRTIPFGRWQLQVLDFGPFKISQAVYFTGSRPTVSSLTGNPNTLAAWLVFSLILTWALYKARRIGTAKFLLAGGLQWAVLLSTLSRAGIGATVVGALLLWMLTSRRAASRLVKGALLFMGAAAGALIFFDPLLKYLPGGLPAEYLSGRAALWETAWKAIQSKPVSGCGFGVSGETILSNSNLVHLHSVYLSVLVEIGLVGLAIFLGFWLIGVVVGWKRSLKHLSSGKTDNSLALAAAGSLLTAFLFHQGFETMILRTNFYTILWVYLAGFATHPLLGNSKTNP